MVNIMFYSSSVILYSPSWPTSQANQREQKTQEGSIQRLGWKSSPRRIYHRNSAAAKKATGIPVRVMKKYTSAAILDKILIKWHNWRAFFLNIVAAAILPVPSPLPLETVLLCLPKKAWSQGVCKEQLWTGGGGFLKVKPLVLKTVTLH